MQILLLLVGVLACSVSVIFIKQSGVDAVLLSGLRLAVAAAVLAPVCAIDLRRHRAKMTWRHAAWPAVPGLVLAAHFITWIIGARLTPAANSTLIVNIVPVVMPVLLWAFARERLSRAEAAATLIVSAGLAVLFAADFRVSGDHFRGDAVCFGSMLLLAVYLALGRRFRHHPTVWLYLAPLYATAAAACLVVWAVQSGDPAAAWAAINWRAEWPWVIALGLVPTVIGHSLLNNAMRRLRGQTVSLLVMTQFIFAGVIAYATLGEAPDWTFYPASLAVAAGGVVAALAAKNEPEDDSPGNSASSPARLPGD
ncbi:MAG: DMT family transporter [Planctomycetota bacterium]